MIQASVEGKGSSGADRSPAQHLVARPVRFDAGPPSMGSGSHAHMTAAVMFKANALVSHLDPPLASDLLNPHTAGTPWTIGASALQLDCLFHLPARQGLVGPNVGLRAKTQNRQSDQPGRSRRRTRQGSTGDLSSTCSRWIRGGASACQDLTIPAR